MDIIIFSKCGLIGYALKNTINNLAITEGSDENISITIYNSIREFESAIINSDGCLIIFDVDNVLHSELRYLFSLVKLKVRKRKLFIFTKEQEESGRYNAYVQASVFTLSKTESMSVVDSMLKHLIYNKELPYNFLSTTGDEVNSRVSNSPRSNPYLTKKQIEVLKYILSGNTNKEISEILSVSNKTISAHRVNIYSKYGVNSLVDLYFKFL
ncbi:LuxR family transcriptional regulator [Yersinia frederiksenii]|uniref:LuxR family transcriptional regulator n=1 Tax=Yersinia frederiksenii TaxID=29484 RepID=UPI0005EA473C|nr:LuxR family transcriptional regulator [Yersinia frederiksenii]CQJ04946.1 LuxR family transcriptional regulatory protein [Yersinia frederiksenii]